MLSEELLILIKKIQKSKAEYQNIKVKSTYNGYPKKLYDTLSSFIIFLYENDVKI